MIVTVNYFPFYLWSTTFIRPNFNRITAFSQFKSCVFTVLKLESNKKLPTPTKGMILVFVIFHSLDIALGHASPSENIR